MAPFSLELRSWAAEEAFDVPVTDLSWFVPLKGAGSIDGQPFQAGECWLADRAVAVHGGEAGTALIARPNAPRRVAVDRAAPGEAVA